MDAPLVGVFHFSAVFDANAAGVFRVYLISNKTPPHLRRRDSVCISLENRRSACVFFAASGAAFGSTPPPTKKGHMGRVCQAPQWAARAWACAQVYRLRPRILASRFAVAALLVSGARAAWRCI